MRSESTPGWLLALAQIPSSLFVMTATRGRASGAVLASWVQQVSYEPPLVSVAIPRGRGIAPLIRDSRCFALCKVHPDDKLLPRRLRMTDDRDWTALETIPHEKLATGAPCIKRAMAVLDCQVIRHLDVEADHELYIGQVIAGRVYTSEPCALKPDVQASGRVDLLRRLSPGELTSNGADRDASDSHLGFRFGPGSTAGHAQTPESDFDEFDDE
ncbi:MAG: flavin reductase [Phycisphaeraceae bacterium]|nr:flavin reductase [Phycisphaeraceae bacterium]MCB9848671.1 flavin reductase [Phycisphaeraceae bacterium]